VYAATLVLLVFGPHAEPLVLTFPQPNLATCWSERNIERQFGVRRRSGFEVHVLCLPEPDVSSSEDIKVG
jgi:hypothetical protein